MPAECPPASVIASAYPTTVYGGASSWQFGEKKTGPHAEFTCSYIDWGGGPHLPRRPLGLWLLPDVKAMPNDAKPIDMPNGITAWVENTMGMPQFFATADGWTLGIPVPSDIPGDDARRDALTVAIFQWSR